MANDWQPQAGDESGNAAERRRDAGYFDKWIRGRVLDIGCGAATVVPDVRPWDIARGDSDATELAGVDAETFDCVYASHVLEHLPEPRRAIVRWWQCVAPGGVLFVAVPDEDLYEQHVWPSIFNPDHKASWTTYKAPGLRAPQTLCLTDMLALLDNGRLELLQRCDWGYDAGKRGQDQRTAERQIEMVVRKVLPQRWRSSLVSRAQCPCGNARLTFEGYAAGKRALLQCPDCGQTSFVTAPWDKK